MNEVGLVMNITELGVTDDVIAGIAESPYIRESGYKKFSPEEVVHILEDNG